MQDNAQHAASRPSGPHAWMGLGNDILWCLCCLHHHQVMIVSWSRPPPVQARMGGDIALPWVAQSSCTLRLRARASCVCLQGSNQLESVGIANALAGNQGPSAWDAVAILRALVDALCVCFLSSCHPCRYGIVTQAGTMTQAGTVRVDSDVPTSCEHTRDVSKRG